MTASPAKRKRGSSPSPPPRPPPPPPLFAASAIQLPIHTAAASVDAPRFTFIAPRPVLGLDTHAHGGVTGSVSVSGGSSPRSRVAARFGSLAIGDEHGGDGDGDGDGTGPIDPIRASLTWQDDEITVYDPNDEDDDGTGVNGIGFKPTPAIAHARALRRRQQLADYRKREEREARARRSRRRPRVYTRARTKTDKDQVAAKAENATEVAEPAPSREASPEAAPRLRRVRFLDTEPVTIRFLEPEVAV